MTRAEIERELELLPKGSIGFKRINGKDYTYHRWYENGKRKEKYVSPEAVEKLRIDLRKRKELESLLKEMQLSEKTPSYSLYPSFEFHSDVTIGNALSTFTDPVKDWKRRDSFNDIQKYIYGNTDSRVLILFGLRRTGKTTLIRQTIASLSEEDRDKTAFIQIGKTTTMADVNKDLKYLSSRGYKYIFIDEVTMLDDFIEGGALFSDIFAAQGMKIVLSGTDSLGFLFAEDEQLYDRTIMIHTTFIPYHEFSVILRIKGIDEYIKYGGTLSLSGEEYNSVFSSYTRTDEYIDSAIAKNIQHSLKNYQDGRHFRLLEESCYLLQLLWVRMCYLYPTGGNRKCYLLWVHITLLKYLQGISNQMIWLYREEIYEMTETIQLVYLITLISHQSQKDYGTFLK